MKKPKGKRLKYGVDYHTIPSAARYAVSCRCGFSTDVPGAASGDEAEALVATRHRCDDVQLLWEAYECEACGGTVEHRELIAVTNNGATALVCDQCRINIALGRTGLGPGKP